MSENKYLISDTSKQLGVEPHVLRYWEEELEMPIKRNEMGHRYYTDEDIRVLKSVRDMKEQGFQLKAIRTILKEPASLQKVPENPPASEVSAELKLEQFQEIMFQIIAKALEKNNQSLSGTISNEISEAVTDRISENVSERLSAKVTEDISEHVSVKLSDSVSERVTGQVSDRIIKQVDYILQENEERAEERFRKLDETIRLRQKANAEAAAALIEDSRKKKKHRPFGKKDKGKSRIFG